MANVTNKGASLRAYQASLTPEQRAARRKAARAAAREREAAMTPEQKEARRAAARARYEALPEEMKAKIRAGGRKPLTDEERAARAEKIAAGQREKWANRTDEERAKLSANRRDWYARLTPEEKTALFARRSAAAKARFEAMTPEQKEQRRAKAAASYAKRLIEEVFIPDFLPVPEGEDLVDILAVSDIDSLAREAVVAWNEFRKQEWLRTEEERIAKRAKELGDYLRELLAKSDDLV